MTTDRLKVFRNAAIALLVFIVLFVVIHLKQEFVFPTKLVIEVQSVVDTYQQVFYDSGHGFNEKESIRSTLKGNGGFEIMSFRLPRIKINKIRIDPSEKPGNILIRKICVKTFLRQHCWTGQDLSDDFIPLHDISVFDTDKGLLSITSTGQDPFLEFKGDFSKEQGHIFPLFLYLVAFLFSMAIFFFFNSYESIVRFADALLPAGMLEKLLNLRPFVWLSLVILLASLVRIYHITYPLDDLHAFRQTQTAGLIRDFYRSGINLFYPTVITLGAPGYVVLEFPLYQAVSAILYKVLSPELIWARLASIFFGLLSVLMVYRITKEYIDQKSAVFASLFFAFAPLTIFYNRVPMPDSLTLLLSLIMLNFLVEGINNKKNVYLLIGIAAGSAGLIMKSPYVAPLYLPIIYMIYKEDTRLKSFLNIRALSAFLIPAVTLFLWQRHANSVNELYFNTDAYPFKQLYSAVVVKLHPVNTWFFGTISQRLDINNYLIILKRINKEILSIVGIPFVIAGFIMLMRRKSGVFFLIWFFSILSSVMLFFSVNVVHDFYQLPIVPILSIYCGVGLTWFTDLFRNKKASVAVTAVFICLYLFMSCSVALRFFKQENDWVGVGQYIDSTTEKGPMIATSLPYVDAWAPQLMYYADRHGFTVPHAMLDENMIEYLKNKDIKYLALIDGGDVQRLIGKVMLPYRRVTENQRAIIYDISSGRGSTVQKNR